METVSSDDSVPDEIIFPSKHYMPKELTQQSEFLQRYPEYDGRNTLIAIIDTGVDPSCPGLQKTTDGKPKIIDCLDLTGAGDVDTSTIRKADENGILIGLTERELKIPSTWKNPSGEWHLGIKPVYELYSDKVKQKIKESKNEEFQKKNKSSIAEALKELNEHESKVGSKSKNLSDKEDRDEIIAKLEFLKEAEKVESESPVADCIVWNDGEKWKACIDLTFTGDLEKAKVMSSYCENHEYGFVSDKCLVSYCLNIHENGNLLEICVPNESHGTHVAHIAAGHFPGEPEKDGLAPGTQIISLGVGDLRRGTYLTYQALLRALNKCIQLKVDIINFSYEISQNFLDTGKLEKFVKDIVGKHGILFIAAAGNNGPGLSTTTYGLTHSSMINVGAYLTAEMKESMYSHYEADSSVVFPFSSRGPCLDGSLGVAFCAPGAAITGVPKQELQCYRLYDGTSMSSPNAVGNIACLLSAMKAESIPISSFRVKLALMNSAKMPEDGSHHPLSLGAGIIQILSAFELIKSAMKSIPTNLTDIKIDAGNNKRGIYLREPFETNLPYECKVTVDPIFTDSGDHDERINFGCPITLKLSAGSEKGFVKFPKYCQLPSSSFHIQIDPTNLETNNVRFAEILGINPENPSLGPLFRLPITVITPATVSTETKYCYKQELTLNPAIPQRVFLQSPHGCTCAAVKIKSCENQTVQHLVVQRLYLQQKIRCYDNDEIRVALHPNDDEFLHFFCAQNQTLEFCFTKQWYQQNSTNVKITIKFFGMCVEPTTLMASNLINKIYITNYLNKNVIETLLVFRDFCQPLIPSEANIEAMKERDIIDGNPSFRLLLTYKFNASKLESFKFMHETVTLYKKHLDCYILQIFTVSKKHIFTTSTAGKSVTLEKGDYIIQVQFRHSDPQFLEKLKDVQLIATQELNPEISCDIYPDAESALKESGAQKFKHKNFNVGEKNEIFMAAVPPFKYPFSYSTGSYLKGQLFLRPKKTYLSQNYSYFDIIYLLAPPKLYSDDKNGRLEIEADKENDDEKEGELKNAIRDIEISYITKETNAGKAMALFERLSTEFPTHAPIYSAEIQRLSKLKDFPGLKKVVEKLLEIAESSKVAEYFGVKSDFSEENLRKKEIMEKKKADIINALFLQANLGLDEYLKATAEDIPDAFQNGFDPRKDNEKKDIVETESAVESKEKGNEEEKFEVTKKCSMTEEKVAESKIKEVPDQSNEEKEDVAKVDSVSKEEKREKDANSETAEKDVVETGESTTAKREVAKSKSKKETDKNVGTLKPLFTNVDVVRNNFVPRNGDTAKAEEKQVASEAKEEYAETATCLPFRTDNGNIKLFSSSDSYESTTAVTANTTHTSEEKIANLDIESSTVTLEEVEKLYRDYMLFADSTSKNSRIIQAKYAVAHGRFGIALSQLQKIIIDQKTTSDYLSTEKAIIQLLEKLGWNHLAEEAQKALLIKHQKSYRLF